MDRQKKAKLVWPDTTTAENIVRYGWAFQVPVDKVMEELQSMGFMACRAAIIATYNQLDELMESA